jgi:hypothetical protein
MYESGQFNPSGGNIGIAITVRALETVRDVTDPSIHYVRLVLRAQTVHKVK